jgi:hypothetical protein
MPSIYDIMIEMNLEDRVSEGLKGIGESFTTLLEQLEKLHEGLSSTALLGAGIGLALGLNKIASAAEQLNDALTKIGVSGYDAEAALTAAERATEAVRGTTTGENAELLRRLTPLMGYSSAMALAPDWARASWWLERYKNMGVDPTRSMETMARVGHGVLGLEGEKLSRFFEEQIKTLVYTGGQVQPQQLSQLFRRGGVAAMGLTPETLMNVLPWLQMNMGGPGRDILGANFANFEKIMMDPKLRGIRPGAFETYMRDPRYGIDFKGTREDMLALRDPRLFAERIGPALREKWGTGPQGEAAIRDIMQKMFSSAIIAEIMTLLITRYGDYMKFKTGREAVDVDEDARRRFQDVNIEASKARLQAAINETFETIGKKVESTYLYKLNSMSGWIEDLNRALKEIPDDKVEFLFNSLGGLAVTLAGLGALRLAGGALSFFIGGANAPILIAAGALVGALLLLSGGKWDETVKALQGLNTGLSNVLDALIRTITGKKDELLGARTEGPRQPLDIPGVHEAIYGRRYGFARSDVSDQFIPKGSFGGNLEIGQRGGFWGGPGPEQQSSAIDRWTRAFLSAVVPNIPALSRARQVGVDAAYDWWRQHHADAPRPGGSWLPQLFRPLSYLLPGAAQAAPSGGGGFIIGGGGAPPSHPAFFGGGAAPPSASPFAFPTPPAPQSVAAMPSFSPGAPRAEQNVNLNVSLNVDGRALGSVVLERILNMYDFSHTGPGANWDAGYAGPETPYMAR